jgi:hypothetical protein
VDRHFFLYELDNKSATVWCYEHSPENPAIFKRTRNIQVPLAPVPKRGEVEPAASVNATLDRWKVTETAPGVNSDLAILLAAVADCSRARRVIRDVLTDFVLELAAETPGRDRIRLEGMYDLSGRWDLLAKIRCAEPQRAALLAKTETELVNEQMIDARENRKDGMFGLFDVVSVNSERPSFDEPANTTTIRRVRLASTEEYERYGLQRAFIYVEVPSKNRAKLIRRLQMAIKQNADIRDTIEAVHLAQEEFVIEVLADPAHPNALNRLNRFLEPELSAYKAQKYTLTSYNYDEA